MRNYCMDSSYPRSFRDMIYPVPCTKHHVPSNPPPRMSTVVVSFFELPHAQSTADTSSPKQCVGDGSILDPDLPTLTFSRP